MTPIAIGYTIVNINGDLGLTGIGPKDTPWPMKCHDNRHTGRSPYSTAHIDGTEKWRFPLYYRASNDPIIDDDGTIYIMGEYEGLPVYLYAINPDGTEKWKFGLDGQIIGSTAVIGEDGTIYIGSWDCRLYALNPNGALKWTFHAGSSIATSPAIAEDGTIYFGTMLSGNKIFAVNPDGSKKWHYQAGDSIHSDPAIGDDGTIYIGSRDNFLYALYPNGDLRWRFEAQDVVKGSPSIADDGTIYVGSFDGYLYAINPDGNKKWECNLGSGTETNPSIASDGTIYIGGVDLWAVNPDDGTIKWTFDLGSNRLIHQSSPTISSDGTIYVGLIVYDSGDSVGAEILAVSSEGAEKWRKRIGNLECQITPGIASDGTVYIGSSSLYSSPETGTYGYLHAFGPLDTNAPLAPIINGPTSGRAGIVYDYTFVTTDPLGKDVFYWIDWGNNKRTEWLGPYPSGYEMTYDYTYEDMGSYTISCRAKNTDELWGPEGTHSVTMPRNRIINNPMFIEFMEVFMDRFPLFARLLNLL